MNRLATFFKRSATRFGVFNPKHYMVAIFSTEAQAHSAELVVTRNTPISPEDITAVSGEEVVRFATEDLNQAGLWNLLMKGFSRAIDTEQTYLDHDLELARYGAGFLVVYCPTKAVMLTVWKQVEPLDPVVARYYAPEAVEHLKGEA